MSSNWEAGPLTEGAYASPEDLTRPCFLDDPQYTSIFPSDLDKPFLDGAFASTGYFDLSSPVTSADATSWRPDTTAPSAQPSWGNANSVDPCMMVDNTTGCDMFNPWQAQMDRTAIDDVMRQYALSTSNRPPRTPSLCSSDGSYNDTSGPDAVAPEQASPHLSTSVASNRRGRQHRVTNGVKRTRGALNTTNPDGRECVARRAAKSVPHSKVERKRSYNSGEDEATSQMRAKKAHSAVERRYRENLNGKITELHCTLLATEFSSWLSDDEGAKLLNRPKEELSKIRKSDVLVNAMIYIHQSEIEMRHMSEEIRRLRGQPG